MRRNDREVTDVLKIKNIINGCDCCRLGFSDKDGVYIVPLNFGYTENEGKRTFYFHGATVGRKIDLIKKTGYAGFELDTNHKLNDSEKPCGYSFRFQSVIGEGPISIVEEIEEKKIALQRIMEHYSKRNNWKFTYEMAASVSVFKLEVDKMSCKEHL